MDDRTVSFTIHWTEESVRGAAGLDLIEDEDV